MPHIHEKIDFTASAYIVHDNKVLLRMHDKYKRWLDIGGHIELGEDPVEALKREVKEESGLEVKILSNEHKEFPNGDIDLPLPAFINKHPTEPGHWHVDMVYVASALSTDIKPGSEESTDGVEFRWFAAEELSDPRYGISPRIQYHATSAIKIAQQHDR
jgi:8-oxo-dGTP pyrophosphatase MutT (NUDIX family)